MSQYLVKVESLLKTYMQGNAKNNYMEKAFAMAESSTGMARERLSLSIMAFLISYALFGPLLPFLCHILCTMYPVRIAYKQIHAQNRKEEDIKNSIIYFCIFSVVTMLDFTPASASIPFYYLLKTSFFVYLYLPSTQGIVKASAIIDRIVKFCFSRTNNLDTSDVNEEDEVDSDENAVIL